MGKAVTYRGITLETTGTHSYRVNMNGEEFYWGTYKDKIVLTSHTKTTKGKIVMSLGQIRVVVKDTPQGQLMSIYEELKCVSSIPIKPPPPLTA